MTTKLEFLAAHPVFADLDDAELLALTQIAQECDFSKDSIIAYQRDVAEGMVIVKSGRLYAREVDPQGAVRAANTRQFSPNDFYGTEWLFETGTHPATVTGSDPGRIIIINGEDFRRFMISYPTVIPHLEPVVDEDGQWYSGLPEAAWEKANKLPLKEHRKNIGPVRLLPDELVEYYARRSKVVLLQSLFWPTLGIIIISLFTYSYIRVGRVGLTTTSAIGSFLAGVVIILLIGMIIFRLLDWRNDYFVITNKHISHREFELRTFRTQLNKIPVSQVQSVTVEKPTFLSNLFNVGSVKITTASAVGTVRFEGIDNPFEVEGILEGLRQQHESMDAAKAQTNMRLSVERHFQIDPGVNPVQEDQTDEDLLRPADQRGIGNNFFKWFNWRIEDGDVITYRRNYFILFWEILLPSLVFGFLVLLAGVVYRYVMPNWKVILSGLAPFLLINFIWLLWRYENWHNDMFQLTNMDVIDIDRKPFGFGESRKQAPLDNIQNVTALRPGFFATIFDYGDVHIETAGAGADIIFDKIPRPSQVLTDIFRRLEENREKVRKQDGEMRREEYAVLLDVYKQELERNRIPQRMPDPDES